MSRQPYIPFYVGDYLKDTRILPLAVRGAWVDLILYMWDAPVRGELVGTLDDFARLLGCEKSEAEFALHLLKQKKTADFDLLTTGEIKIVSRKMKRDYDISKKRSEAGKKGAEAKFASSFAKANPQAKPKQNTEVDIDNENDNKIKKESRDFYEVDVSGDEIIFPIDTPVMRQLWAAWKEARWVNYGLAYGMHGEQAALKQLEGMNFHEAQAAIQQAIAGKWKNLYPEKNGKRKSLNDSKSRIDEIVKHRFGAKGAG